MSECMYGDILSDIYPGDINLIEIVFVSAANSSFLKCFPEIVIL